MNTQKKYIVISLVSIIIILLILMIAYILTRPKTTNVQTEPNKPITSNQEQLSNNTSATTTINTPDKDPQYTTTTIVSNLSHPWDIGFLPDNSIIFTQRENKLMVYKDGTTTEIDAPENVYVEGEGGMMGLAVDPDFKNNKYIYLCFNSNEDNNLDVRLVRWKLNEQTLTDRKNIITNIPTNESGRHSGCQPEFGPDGYIWVGTGDAAIGTNPQNPKSLGGKILRVDRDGNAAPGNLSGNFDPKIYSYGHRNVQGITFLKTTSSNKAVGLSSEHGPTIEDEVNMLDQGNFGWNPVPSYNEDVPMTDKTKYPDAIESVWNTGNSILAISGITQITGPQWGLWDGAIAVSSLKGQQVKILKFEGVKLIEHSSEFKMFGRIRTIQQGPDENLYILTDIGNDKDSIIKVTAK